MLIGEHQIIHSRDDGNSNSTTVDRSDSNRKGYTLYRFMFGIKVIEIIHISQSTGYSK